MSTMIKECEIPLIRGYKLDKYGNGVHLKNDYLLVSPVTAKYHFNEDVSHLFQKDSEIISMLDSCNFWLSVTTTKDYWNKYLSVGHPISTRYSYPEWIGRMVLGQTEEEIQQVIESIINYLNSVKTANKITDLFLRIQTIFPHYELKRSSTDPLKYMYTYCGYPLKKKALALSFQINNIITQTSTNNQQYAIAQCLVSFIIPLGEPTTLAFDVLIFTSEYIHTFQARDSKLFPPHVIVEQFDFNKIKQYLLYTFGFIKASTQKELLFKLSIFTDSFMPEELISQELYHDFESQLKCVYMDCRTQ